MQQINAINTADQCDGSTQQINMANMANQHDRPMFCPKCFKTGIHDGPMQWANVTALAAGNTQAQWHMGNGTGASGTWACLAANGRGPWPQQKHGGEGRGGGAAQWAASGCNGGRHTCNRPPHPHTAHAHPAAAHPCTRLIVARAPV